MYAFKPKMEPLFAELDKHLNKDDMTEARKIIADIEIRIQRFRKAKE